MSIKRVLLIGEGIDGRSGWTTYARDLQRTLAARGYETVMATHREAAPDGGSALPRPLLMLSQPWRGVAVARRIARIVAETHPDIIHITAEPYAMVVPWLGARVAERTVMTIHGSYGVRPFAHRLTRLAARRYHDLIARFITVSAYTRQRVAAELEARVAVTTARRFLEKAHVVHNSVQLPRAPTVPEPHEGHAILHVGGIKPRKGIIETIHACAAYRRRSRAPFRLSFVGRDPGSAYSRRAQALVRELGLDQHVIFRGVISEAEVQQSYASADLFLMPATTTPDTFEGFGLVYLEANAHGVPCIGPDTSGAAEAIADGRSGFQCDPASPEDIADKMERILDRHEISRVDCRRWAEQHDIATHVRKTEAVYDLIAPAA